MRAEQNKLIAVVQPHRYTRLRDLFSDFCACFNDADHVIVSDVYAAGEAPIEGFERDDLVEGLRAWGHRSVHAMQDPAHLAAQINDLATSGDLVMCLGAGTVTQWASSLPQELALLRSASPNKEAGE
jgi:UDP-N-acetylmuramate--alanine ligase